MSRRIQSVFAAVVVSALPLAAQDNQTVKITVPRANVRSEPSEKAPVLTQVTPETTLILLGTEGDWFHVRLGPDSRLGGLRIDAYISKRVAKIVPGAAAPAAAPSPAPSTGAASPSTEASAEGISVALTGSSGSSWLKPHSSRVIRRDAQTWAWILSDSAADETLDDRRPAFVVLLKDVIGVNPDELTPMIVRLTPAAEGGRLIAASRGAADLAASTAPTWDPSKDLKQDVVRASIEVVQPGAVRIQPAADLASGQYAIVLRPAAKRKLSGATVPSTSGEGRLLALAWDFAIR